MAVLETARLTLRPIAPDDDAWWRAIRMHAAVTPFLSPLGDDPVGRTREVMDAFARHWSEHGYGPYAVIEKASGRPIGHHGLRFLPEFGETEALWTLDPAVHGRGYATEAGHAVVAPAFGAARLAGLIAITTEANCASRRVMEKLGFRYEKNAVYKGVEVLYHRLAAPISR